jgi:hypothetical protein
MVSLCWMAWLSICKTTETENRFRRSLPNSQEMENHFCSESRVVGEPVAESQVVGEPETENHFRCADGN